MPNSIAFLVLAAWPLVMVALFRLLPPGRALVWSLLGGYLLLPPHPTAFDFPLMPPLSKLTLPNVMALIIVMVMVRPKLELLPRSTIGKVLTLTFVFCPVFTVLTNPEPVIFATGGLRGLHLMDVVALVINQAILLISYLLARQLLNTKEDLRDLLIAMMIAGVAYGFPMLLEVRLSPQINTWVYGFFQHSFEQAIRSGGFRSLVFLSHGIWAAMLAMMTLSAAIILWKNEKGKIRIWAFAAALFLAVVLVLNKTLSPVLYGAVVISVVVMSSWRVQLQVAVLLAMLSIGYPVMKGAQLVPEAQILSLAAAASEDRAGSLKFRFDNENILMERAREKPLFGWGSWGRNHIHDPISGTIMTVSDGRWVITLGVFGWVGFLAEFGMLALPIFLLAYVASGTKRVVYKKRRQQASVAIPVRRVLTDRIEEHALSPITGGIALVLALNIVDLLPNATLTPLTWLLAGALLGYSERIIQQREEFLSLKSTDNVPLENSGVLAKTREPVI